MLPSLFSRFLSRSKFCFKQLISSNYYSQTWEFSHQVIIISITLYSPQTYNTSFLYPESSPGLWCNICVLAERKETWQWMWCAVSALFIIQKYFLWVVPFNSLGPNQSNWVGSFEHWKDFGIVTEACNYPLFNAKIKRAFVCQFEYLTLFHFSHLEIETIFTMSL